MTFSNEQVAPVVKQEDPDAKIVAGAVGAFTEEATRDWLVGMLQDGVAPIVDFVSWHTPAGESPYTDAEYSNTHWQDYAANVELFKKQAASLGFKGEYMVEELVWRTQIDETPEIPLYADLDAGKYASRAIIRNLNMGLKVVSNQIREPSHQVHSMPRIYVIRVLSSVMAGATPANLSVQVSSSSPATRKASFICQNGDFIVAIWNDVIAGSSQDSQRATVTINSSPYENATGIDTINGFEQCLNIKTEGEKLIVDGLLLTDYPIILRFSQAMETPADSSSSEVESLLWVISLLGIIVFVSLLVLLRKKWNKAPPLSPG